MKNKAFNSKQSIKEGKRTGCRETEVGVNRKDREKLPMISVTLGSKTRENRLTADGFFPSFCILLFFFSLSFSLLQVSLEEFDRTSVIRGCQGAAVCFPFPTNVTSRS